MPDAVSLDPSCDPITAAAAGAYTPTPSDFQCSHPKCSQLLVQPRIPVCGHPLCSLTCLARDTTAGVLCCPLCRLPVGQEPAVCRQVCHLQVHEHVTCKATTHSLHASCHGQAACMPNLTSCSQLLIPVCNSLPRWFRPCFRTHLSKCSGRCLRQQQQRRSHQWATLQALHLLAGNRTSGPQSSKVLLPPTVASCV